LAALGLPSRPKLDRSIEVARSSEWLQSFIVFEASRSAANSIRMPTSTPIAARVSCMGRLALKASLLLGGLGGKRKNRYFGCAGGDGGRSGRGGTLGGGLGDGGGGRVGGAGGGGL